MSGFKDMLARDIHRVFLNTDEFAEKRTVKYDGVTYEDISVVLTGPVRKSREQLKDDHIQGLHLVTTKLCCSQEDLGGTLPKQGGKLQINTREGGKFFKEYTIVSAAHENGMFHIELEAMAE